MAAPADSSSEPFELTVDQPRSGVVVLSIVGELDHLTAQEATACLEELRNSDQAHLVLDLTRVGFMGAAGASLLLAARPWSADGTAVRPALHLVGVADNRAVRRVLEIVGVDSPFSTFHDLQECLRRL